MHSERERNRMRGCLRLTTVFLLASLVGGCGAGGSDSAEVAPQELLLLEERGALLLDVRSPEEYASGHVPGAVNVPYDELEVRLPDLGAATGDPVVVYCEKGPRASKALGVLRAAGYGSARTLAGHMARWRVSGLPVER